ncbi:MAG: DUF3486 family protein [Firmicutes bacterium]|nr:DUF3486 family protein [Bacillota bacterium]
MSDRRRHSKIVTDLPQEVTEAVNQRLTEGYTYREIAEWLAQMGHPVSKSAVGRYGKHWLARLERLRIARDQAKAIIDQAAADPEVAMGEAASQLAMQLIMEAMMASLDKGPSGLNLKIVEAMKALAQLERSGVAREKLKQEIREKAKRVAQDVEKKAAAAGLDPETIKYIREQIYGLAS